MITLSEIEKAVEGLGPEDLAAFRSWFSERDAELWDRQIESDIEAGHFDKMAEEALRDFRAGKCTEL